MRAVPLPEGQWEWQDEGGGWHPYAPAVQRLLGACQACGVDQWEVQAAGRCYQVQLGVKSGPAQQTNVETGVHRPVRCRAQDEVGSTVGKSLYTEVWLWNTSVLMVRATLSGC